MDVKAAIECLSKMIVEYEERSKKYTYNGATEALGYKILKEKIDSLYTARSNLKHIANELDVEREKRTHVEERNCELEKKLEEIERELANTKNKNIVLRAVLEGFNGNVENLQKCLVELFENSVSKLVESDKNGRR